MTISSSDLKLRKPERLTDFDDGGGRMVWDEVADGQVNNLFPDVASGDRVFGRVSLRPAFLHVATTNTDILAQAIGLIVARPEDPAVNVVMFSTGSSVDERRDAQRQIETFRLPANEAPYILYGNHHAGTSVLTVFGRQGMPEPNRGDVFVLSVEGAGHAARSEPVKVNSVLYHETEEFSDGVDAVFYRDVMQIELTRSIEAIGGSFPGMAPTRNISARPATIVRATRQNESTRFYGTQPLEADIVASPSAKVFDVKVPTPFQPLVPASQSESPVVDKLAGMGSVSQVQSGPAGALSLAFSASAAAGAGIVRYLGMGFAVGSLQITAGAAALVDDGHGGIVPADANPASPWSGVVDYSSGRVEIRHATGVGSTSFAVSATPAGTVVRQSFSDQIPVTLNNQFASYVRHLRPVPAPGTLIVEFRILGQWIRLTDDGLGALVGNPGDGSGTVNYQSGSVTLSLPALPDLDSSILLFWGTPITADRRDGDTDIQPPYITATAANPAIAPSSLAITYLASGSPVVLHDDGKGNIRTAGDAIIGTVAYSTGEIGFRPAVLPDDNAAIQIAYDHVDAQAESLVPSVVGHQASFTLTNGPAKPGSVRLRWYAEVSWPDGVGGPLITPEPTEVIDLGNGTLMGQNAVFGLTGTIDYTTGSITVQTGYTRTAVYYEYGWRDGRYGVIATKGYEVSCKLPAGATIECSYSTDGAAETPQTESVPAPAVAIDLTPLVTDSIVPGSLRFGFGGRTYVDRGGLLYYGVDPANNAGTAAGSIDYDAGVARITRWAGGASNTLGVTSLLTQLQEPGIADAYFRTPGSPVQQGSLILRANLIDGTQLAGTADINGIISGDQMTGSIDADTGVVSVRFGELVTAAGHEDEPWFDPDLIDADGKIWRPALVNPATLFFGAVVFEYVQVSPTILGLDPILLPNDGRVRIYRPGDQLVLIDERETAAASPTAGQVVNLGRTNLSQIEIRDAAGTPVESQWYTLDLDAGTVTFADPVPIGWAPYVLPLAIRHRVDVRKGILRVQHNGLITLTSGIDRSFDAATTLVCSALVLGERYGSPDVQARVGVFFDQASDEVGVFKDSLVGNPATASYNRTAYPIELTNRGAMTQRWKLRFTGATTFVVIGEDIGQLPETYSIDADCAPINPITVTLDNPAGDPYFIIRAGGWGGGWATGNIVRLNTVGAEPKIWFARVTQPSDPTDLERDSYRFQAIGDAA